MRPADKARHAAVAFPGYLAQEIVAPAALTGRCEWSATQLPIALLPAGIEKINFWVNDSICYHAEGTGDVWQDPDYTLALRIGDCDDFAILKYAALRQNGYDAEDMAVLCGNIMTSLSGRLIREKHAVLVVAQPGDQPLVLDNRTSMMRPLRNLVGQFAPWLAVNEQNAWFYLPVASKVGFGCGRLAGKLLYPVESAEKGGGR